MTARGIDFLKALEGVGYKKNISYARFGRRDAWYVRPDASPGLANLAYVEYRPKLDAYTPLFGFYAKASRNSLELALPLIKEYLPPAMRGGIWPLERRPCWTLFSAAEALGWDQLCIPGPRHLDDWADMFEEMVERFLRPTIWSVSSLEGVRDLLLKDSGFFSWSPGCSVLRAVEIVAISRQISLGDARILADLNLHKREISRDLCEGKRIDEFFQSVIDAI